MIKLYNILMARVKLRIYLSLRNRKVVRLFGPASY